MNNIVCETEKINPFIESALQYANKNLPVVPIKPKTKKPKLEKWPDRTLSNPETLIATWEFESDLNIGIKLGKGSVIDIECDSELAEQQYQALWEGNPPSVPTYHIRRGYHLLFRWR